MVYEMLTGRLPFPGATVGELMAAVATREARSIKQFLPTASPQLEQFFARALARDPSARFASATEMRAALHETLTLRPSNVPIVATQSAGMVGLAQMPAPVGAHQMTQATGHGAYVPSPGYATPPSGVPQTTGTPTYASTGASGQIPVYRGPSTAPHAKPVRPAQTAPTPSFPTGTNTAPSTIAAGSAKTPWVIAIVGTLATVAIVLAIVLTRTKEVHVIKEPAPAPVAPVATTAPPPPPPPEPTPPAPTNNAAPAEPTTAPTTTPATTTAPSNTNSTSTKPATTTKTATPKRATAPEDPYTNQATTPSTAGSISVDERCQSGCNAARSCGLALSTCIADCKANEGIRACMDLALANRCSDAALCAFHTTCPGVKLGTGTCNAAMMCQIQSCAPNDLACGCRCMGGMASKNVHLLLRVGVCAMNCKYDETCMAARCAVWARACQQQ